MTTLPLDDVGDGVRHPHRLRRATAVGFSTGTPGSSSAARRREASDSPATAVIS